jgi:hypothetical protein
MSLNWWVASAVPGPRTTRTNTDPFWATVIVTEDSPHVKSQALRCSGEVDTVTRGLSAAAIPTASGVWRAKTALRSDVFAC